VYPFDLTGVLSEYHKLGSNRVIANQKLALPLRPEKNH